MMTRRLTSGIVMICLTLLVSVGQKLRADQPKIATSQPDTNTQSILDKLAQTDDVKAFDQQLESFLPASRENPTSFFAQLFIFAGRHDKDSMARLMVATIIKKLDLSKDQLVAAAAPHLDSTDELVRKYATQVLIDQEDWSASRPPDFSGYRAVVESDVQAGREPQASLIAHMFKSEPGVALQTLVRAFQLRKPDDIKPILWGEHVVAELFWKRRNGFVENKALDPEAVKQLDSLSRHDRYWVRLYVAAILQQNPEMANPELVKRLSNDVHPLVKQFMQPAK